MIERAHINNQQVQRHPYQDGAAIGRALQLSIAGDDDGEVQTWTLWLLVADWRHTSVVELNWIAEAHLPADSPLSSGFVADSLIYSDPVLRVDSGARRDGDWLNGHRAPVFFRPFCEHTRLWSQMLEDAISLEANSYAGRYLASPVQALQSTVLERSTKRVRRM
ncbi:hypothetical protein Q5752_007119 [Cryptotrichosporon argae]